MSAWVDDEVVIDINEIDRKFEDNFISKSEFQKLDDSEEYIKILEKRLEKIRKNPTVLKQLKIKREELIGNLLNSSTTKITTDKDIELEEVIESNKIISHLIPEQPQTIGEIAHLIKHDQLDIQKQEEDLKTENLDKK
ncbi:uncharacterized protein [Chironomus tepperi]|uniref:uncharacterized protein n=1 Tax=Chironomus tepperi TaxID=113505 RepID=UPI00391EF2DB